MTWQALEHLLWTWRPASLLLQPQDAIQGPWALDRIQGPWALVRVHVPQLPYPAPRASASQLPIVCIKRGWDTAQG